VASAIAEILKFTRNNDSNAAVVICRRPFEGRGELKMREETDRWPLLTAAGGLRFECRGEIVANEVTLRPDIQEISPATLAALSRVVVGSVGLVSFAVNSATGKMTSLRGAFAVATGSPREAARIFMGDNAAAFGVARTLRGFTQLEPEVVGPVNRIRMQQIVNDVDSGGNVVSVCTQLAAISDTAETTLALPAATAAAAAKEAIDIDVPEEFEGKLVILDPVQLPIKRCHA
jgi:hypothetical protein